VLTRAVSSKFWLKAEDSISSLTFNLVLNEGQSPLHMVSSFATSLNLVLGQEKVSETSNEITAIPKLLNLLDISGIMIEATRDICGEVSHERRFYISSLPTNAEIIAKAVRAHWGIENQLHWVLDLTFREDQLKVREKTPLKT
jgi:predicted transposase YbfD/YdcC